MSEGPSLDPAVFARLARLELSDEERRRYAKEFESLLNYFNQIREVDTTGVEPMVYALEASLRARADAIAPSVGREILKNAPATEGGEFFSVPKVIES
ncbi:MAG: Asp-tRNA(Asn)/Glu-tRNA(Gln) amidotransferase subunit GatC [Planctomycetes bacterium]|nr:Asp-tRNA(Asn)/Glu-tRNA(Gln) amidotransferase subunit GatC [Planctomycetota bacterium]